MDTYLLAVVLSLGVGGLYAALAQGLLLTYRGSGVVNFGYGAIALYGAYTFSELVKAGRYVVPPLPNPLAVVVLPLKIFGVDVDVPDIPTFITFASPVSTLLAWVLTIATGAILGLLLHLLVFRPLRHAAPLAKVVASVGVMLALQATISLRFGTESRAGVRVLPTGAVSVLGQTVPVDRLCLAGFAVLSCLALVLFHRFTRFGWAAQAASENEKGAILSGLSPQLLAAGNWCASAALATVVGILFAGITSLNPTNFSLYIIPSLAAVLVAGFSSFTLATAAAFGVAALQGIALPLQGDIDWLPDVGLADGLPLLVIIVVMWLRGKSLPGRDNADAERLPDAPEPRHALPVGVVLTVTAVLGALFLPFEWRGAIINSAIGVVIAASLVLLVGFVGQISLMQLAVSGMAAVLLARFGAAWDIGFPLAPLLAIGGAVVLGLVTALPALRLRGTYLAIVTLAAALAFESMVLRRPDILDDGFARVVPPSVSGWDFGVNGTFPVGRSGVPNPGFALFVIAMAALTCYVLVNVRRSGIGRQFVAVRSNERAAAAAGLSLTVTKMTAFAIAAALAGLAGVLGAYQFESVSASSFSTFGSLGVLAVAFLGGIGRVSGAVVAGVIATGGVSTEILDSFFHMGTYEPLILAVGLVFTAVLNPDGISGAVAHMAHQLRRTHAPSSVGRSTAATVVSAGS